MKSTNRKQSPMMALLAKTIIVCAIPKVVDTVYDFFFVPEKRVLPEEHSAIIGEPKALPSEYPTETQTVSSPEEKTLVTPAPTVVFGGNTIRKSEATDAERFNAAQDLGNQIAIVKPKIVHKRHDHSKITQWHFDIIMEMHARHLHYNKSHPTDRQTVHDLCRALNNRFGYDKGVTSYSKVYLGKIQREDLESQVALPF